ncbi:SpaH/EbpB family LPXTG-anchored major pilin [Bifidobacterium mongoliense]|uniref:SpaH/EbpB family LPXTG-anchored major pilin n=1 Tax=Bifidobacterium mongoliense TaxID=518643 RepID=UPI0030ECAA50
MLKYDSATGTFTSVPSSFNQPTAQNRKNGSLVTGAVSLSTGMYMFGAFGSESTGGWTPVTTNYFYLYQWNPNTKVFTTLGKIETRNNQGNGDMAFDSAGNLYIVGSGTGGTSIYTVTAANLSAANGGVIPRSATKSTNLSDINNVNGMAFDSDGTVYLGNTTKAIRYDPSTNPWTQLGEVVTNKLSSSSDLASCSSPAHLTVQKDVVGRVDASDQFYLAVKNGSSVISDASTQGDKTGIQDDQVGPVAVRTGGRYTISESMAGGSVSPAANYGSTWSCIYNGSVIANGGGTSGSVTIPNVGSAAVDCTFTNTPKPVSATVNVHKLIKYYDQATPQPISGWTVGASGTATSGSLTQSPVSTTQQTNASGVASWGLNFNNANGVANVKVNEQQQANYKFDAGNKLNQCKVTGNGASGAPISITSQDGVSVSSVKPGQTVDCTFVNVYTGVPTKEVADPTDGVVIGSTVPWTIKAPVQPDKPGDITKFMVSDKLDSRLSYKGLSVEGFAEGADYTVDPASAANGNTVTVTFTADGLKKLKAGDVVTLTLNTTVVSLGDGVIPNQATVFTNDNGGKTTSKPGEPGTNPTTNWGPLAVLKHAEGDEQKVLAGAEFTVYSDEAATKPVGSFTTGADGKGSIVLFVGNDSDTSQVYYLKETKAPAGYVLDSTVHTVTVNAGVAASAVVLKLSNKQQDHPNLPLTGAAGTIVMTLGGLALVVAGGAAYTIARKRSAR